MALDIVVTFGKPPVAEMLVKILNNAVLRFSRKFQSADVMVT